MGEGRLIKYVELLGGALLINPVLSVFKVEVPTTITQYLLGFAIAYIIIEEFKRIKAKINEYLSNKIKESVKKEMKNAKKK